MNSSARRLLAVAVTGVLVSAPALTLGGPVHASTASPAALDLGTVVTDTIGGVLGGLTGSTGSTTPDPLGALLDGLSGTLSGATGGSGGATDPVTGLVTTLATDLTGALTTGHPTDVLTGLAEELTGLGADPGDVAALLGGLSSEDAQAITDELLGALPLTDLFGGAVPDAIQAILDRTGATPTDTAGLIAALTSFYQAQGMSAEDVKNDAAAQKLSPAALAALLAALKRPANPTPTAHPTPTAKPTAACTRATNTVKRLQKQLKSAKKKHQKAKAHALAKKLAKARKAKKSAC